MLKITKVKAVAGRLYQLKTIARVSNGFYQQSTGNR